MSNPRPPLDRRAAVIGLATVVAANVLHLSGASIILDPLLSMEPFYIEMAQQPVSSILRQDPAWGPLYAMWLKPLVTMLGDPLAVYIANVYCLSIGVSVMIYLYLLLLTRRAAVGAGAALVFLVCDLNVPLLSKVGAFALMVMLVGFAVSELLPRGARRTAAAAAGVLLAAYARPEVYPAAILLWLATLWLAAREAGEVGGSILLWPAGGLVAVVMLASCIGIPLLSGRLMLAFREHFAWNWSRWHNTSPDALAAWQQAFGTAQTALQAVQNNPAAIAHHLSENLIGTLSFLAATTFRHYPFLAPATNPELVWGETLLVSAALFGSLILVAARASLRHRMFDRYGHLLLPFAAVALCSLGAAVVVFPLAHYLVIPGVLLMLTGTLAVALIVPAERGGSAAPRALAALVCLAAVPKPYVLPSAYEVTGAPFKAKIAVARTVTDTVGLVRSLHLPVPVQVLTFTDGVGELLGTGFHEIKIWQKGTQPLSAYLRDNDVGVIISLGPGQQSVMANDREWNRFESAHEAAGFARVVVPNHEAVRLYVRTALMGTGGG